MKFMKIMFSCGHLEEGILEYWNEDSKWIKLLVKGNPDKILNINENHIASYEIENIVEPETYKNPPKAEGNKKIDIKTTLLKGKQLAELRMKENLSKEYSDNVYDSQIAMLKK